ncbi:TBC-domain-containing protein [Macrolepiota fuliginosa MF-IS2]|uniref:TBC-domain-containing protein n=1 Tax=Macrolepiota fuliginosa MF-IS2 TaxID=1400762 RepID=A0A9P6C6R9_9AGAR|nr:TBC-domain-containing protein [Macrolepiota fuliginosa MF-IS2]
MASTHLKTPAHSHPLSPDELPSRGRRSREPPRTDAKPTTNYFTLKAQLEQDTSDTPNWDGSVRGYGKLNKRRRSDARAQDKPSATSPWDRQQEDGMLLGTPKDNTRHEPEFVITEVFDSDQYNSLVTGHVLSTKWHECADDAIEAAVSKLASMEAPGDVVNHPYFTSLRILSSAYHSLAYARSELQHHKRLVEEKEAARRKRADELLHELQPSERDIARRVIQSIFTDDDENLHQVQRRQSAISLMESLSEAIADEVPLSRSIPKPMTPMPEETTFQLDHPSEPSSDQASTSIADDTPTNESETHSAPSLDGVKFPSLPVPPILDAKQRQDRASIGDWMGTLWGKSKPPRSQDGHTTVASPTPSSDNTPRPRRKTAKSVFGTLGISILNPVPSTSSKRRNATETQPPALPETIPSDADADVDAESDAKSTAPSAAISIPPSIVPSAVSSPIQHTFIPPTLAAPTLTTTLDPPTKPASIASSVIASASSVVDPPVVMMQGATLRAIAHAIRVMTNEPGSILTDQGRETSELIATKAMLLIKNARDQGINFQEKFFKERKDASVVVVVKKDETSDPRPLVTLSPTTGPDATMSLNRALGSTSAVDLKKKGRAAGIVRTSSPFVSPLFGSFGRQQRRGSSAMPSSIAQNTQSTGTTTNQSSLNTTNTMSTNAISSPKPKPKLASVPLESIIPAISKPPTQYLSRGYTYTPLTSRDFRFSLPLGVPPPYPHSASRFSLHSGDGGAEDASRRPPLTDRYGFIYDIALYDVLLLIRARECGNSAPACLTGVKIADREEDNSWPEDDVGSTGSGRRRRRESIEIVKGRCTCDGESDRDRDNKSVGSGERGRGGEGEEGDAQSALSVKSRSSSKSRKRSSVVLSSGTTTASSNGGTGSTSFTTSILSINDDTPRHACANTIRKLLDQLTEIHDQQQAAQQKEWNAFVKQRSRIKFSSNKPSANQTPNMGNALLGLNISLGLTTTESNSDDEELGHTEGLINFAQLGLSSARDERREFGRLVRNGIPLAFRPKVWMECSGALDMKEPGLFRDFLSEVNEKEEGSGSIVAEIEKDVGRTMPLNVFFGGDGAGVDKLRRVLVAYSRRNPAVGYCQGMNLITSTILLVHADEEDAFWMLAAIVEKILPEDFFSPSLLPSRACPLVLLDYVAEHLPKLHAHMTELGIDLAAICFSWFLSLFTDCLPVETLFRVWDVFLVDGLDVLFRIALAILRRNEQELLSCESIPAVYVALENLPTRMWEADKLLQVEAELRPVLVHSDIIAKRDKHVAELSQIMSQ